MVQQNMSKKTVSLNGMLIVVGEYDSLKPVMWLIGMAIM